MQPPRRRARWPHVVFALWCAATLFCVAGPGWRLWGSAARPFVLGLPFSVAWVVGWTVLTVVVLALYFAWDTRRS